MQLDNFIGGGSGAGECSGATGGAAGGSAIPGTGPTIAPPELVAPAGRLLIEGAVARLRPSRLTSMRSSFFLIHMNMPMNMITTVTKKNYEHKEDRHEQLDHDVLVARWRSRGCPTCGSSLVQMTPLHGGDQPWGRPRLPTRFPTQLRLRRRGMIPYRNRYLHA